MKSELEGPYLVELLNSLEDGFRISSMPEHCTQALDVGCGSGLFVEKLRKSGVDAYGVDINELSLSRFDTEGLAKADAHFLPFPDESFDFVTSHCVFHELHPTESLQEMKRVLRVGGVLNIIDVSMSLHQHVSAAERLHRIQQQMTRRLRFAAHFGPGIAYALTQYLQSPLWKDHRQDDRHTTLSMFEEIAQEELPGATTGKVGNGVLMYLNWVKQ